MSDPVLTLHIGFPKSGSSSIQASFSKTALFKTIDGNNAAYGAITKNGKLLLGNELQRTSQYSNSEFVASAHKEMASFTDDHRFGWAESIRNAEIKSLLMSRETWSSDPSLLANYLTPFWKGKIRIVAFVRPQIEYLNSAWWQWGAWTGEALPAWLNKRKLTCGFAARIEQYKSIFPDAEFRVHPLNSAIVERCLDAMDCSANQVASLRSNTSLSGPILRLFQRHSPRLRTVHGSGIDFVLGRELPNKSSAPWVIPKNLAENLILYYRDSNKNLLEYMSKDDRATVEADARWWDYSAYADRVVEDWRPRPPNSKELDALAADLTEVIWKKEIFLKKIARSMDKRND